MLIAERFIFGLGPLITSNASICDVAKVPAASMLLSTVHVIVSNVIGVYVNVSIFGRRKLSHGNGGSFVVVVVEPFDGISLIVPNPDFRTSSLSWDTLGFVR